jgi:hypothetical protein
MSYYDTGIPRIYYNIPKYPVQSKIFFQKTVKMFLVPATNLKNKKKI